MIIARLTEGLGNQLFQYAAARYLSYIQQTDLKIDVLYFEHYILHKYSLHNFNIKASIASPEEVYTIDNEYKEKAFNFDPDLANSPSDTLLKGYWQSEKYFSKIKDLIREDFQITFPLLGLNKMVADMIRSSNAVCLHIRRGDYVTNATTNKYHGVCDLNYYERCIQIISEKISNPHFFVFSDDPEWSMKNINTRHETTFVTHNNADTNFEDLRLMSLCKHNIIANSTFSWWGAWLNHHKDKIVLAPKNWFNEADSNTVDLIPDNWQRI